MVLSVVGPSGSSKVHGDTSGLGGEIRFEGANNSVRFGRRCVSATLRLRVGPNVHVEIGDNCILGHLEIFAAGDNRVTIGARSGFNGRVRLLMHEAGAISFGADCLIGQSDFTISDMHSIIDAASGRRINPAGDIRLAEHVWVGEGALILKGVSIGADSIVGARAVVTGDIPPGSLAAGVPARVIRSGVSWRHELR
ncbi:MAG TPA: acyltransferase [Rhodoblastus sp.]|nr:acyltransferase [Rhodoblastus sp.]